MTFLIYRPLVLSYLQYPRPLSCYPLVRIVRILDWIVHSRWFCTMSSFSLQAVALFHNKWARSCGITLWLTFSNPIEMPARSKKSQVNRIWNRLQTIRRAYLRTLASSTGHIRFFETHSYLWDSAIGLSAPIATWWVKLAYFYSRFDIRFGGHLGWYRLVSWVSSFLLGTLLERNELLKEKVRVLLRVFLSFFWTPLANAAAPSYLLIKHPCLFGDKW